MCRSKRLQDVDIQCTCTYCFARYSILSKRSWRALPDSSAMNCSSRLKILFRIDILVLSVNLTPNPKWSMVKLTHLAQKIWLVRLQVQVEMFCRTFQNGSVIDQIGLGELQLIGWPKPKQGKQQKSKKLTIVKAICGKGNVNG